MSTADPNIRDTHIDPSRPPEAELRITLREPFSLALAGDCIASRPISLLKDRLPGFSAIVDILHDADLACGNLETSILDISRFAGHPFAWDDDWALLAEPSTAADLAALGFRLMGLANNHALDWGIEGMRETIAHLDAAAITHAGAGENLALSRRPAYAETRKGRIGMVSAATTFRPTTEALAPNGPTPGRPGISALRLRQVDLLPPGEIDRLFSLAQAKGENDQIHLFGRRFEAGPAAGFRHEMNHSDLSDILRSIRLGKQHADLLVVMLHAHETSRDGYPEPPSFFLKQFSRAAIDAGADVVSVSGIHHLGPVDLYKGRPVFYGLGNFIWSDMQEFLPSDLVDLNCDLMSCACEHPEKATAADFNAIANASYFNHPEVFETVLPVLCFEDKVFRQAVLHPVELGYGDPLTTSGIPRLATGENARRILERLRDTSAAYGCEHRIEILDGLGYLRPPK